MNKDQIKWAARLETAIWGLIFFTAVFCLGSLVVLAMFWALYS